MKKSLISIFVFAAGFAFAATPSEIASYKSGDSMSWYHELIRDAYNPEKMASAEDIVLQAMSSKDMSDEAFRLACKILKPSASEKSLTALQQHLDSKNRVAPVFDVLVSCELPQTDKVLISLLTSKNSDVSNHAITALGTRKNVNAIKSIVSAVKDKESANAAVVALGKIPSPESAVAILQISKKADSYLVENSLERLRELLFAGKNKAALKIKVPNNALYDLYFEKIVSPKKAMESIDKAIAEPDGKLAKYAARFANTGRTFENSSELVKAYKNLSDGAKVAAIRSFALSKDSRFYSVIESDVNDKNNSVSNEALYACEFIAPDSAIEKLVKILGIDSSVTTNRTGASHIAQYVLSRMPSKAVQKEMEKQYASTKNPIALQILIERGTPKMMDELVARYMNPNDANLSGVSKVMANEMGYDSLEMIAKKFSSLDEKNRRRVLQQIVKFLSQERNKNFRKNAFNKCFAGVKLTDYENEILETRVFNPQKKK